MSCDIHWFVETRDPQHQHIWHAVEVPREALDGFWTEVLDRELQGDDPEYLEHCKLNWRIEQNYRLFDALNGVRCQSLSTGLTSGRFWYSMGDTDDHPHDIIGQKYGPNLDEFGHHIDWPMNTSARTRARNWDDDGHSYCWAHLEDLQDERLAQAGRDNYINVIKHMEKLSTGPCSVRALWFYDN
jgi:hypothetical protein